MVASKLSLSTKPVEIQRGPETFWWISTANCQCLLLELLLPQVQFNAENLRSFIAACHAPVEGFLVKGVLRFLAERNQTTEFKFWEFYYGKKFFKETFSVNQSNKTDNIIICLGIITK